jgi:hypothetical protein
MTPEEALKYKRKGGKLYEPLTFNPAMKVENITVIHIPATHPHDEGLSGNEVIYNWQVQR